MQLSCLKYFFLRQDHTLLKSQYYTTRLIKLKLKKKKNVFIKNLV